MKSVDMVEKVFGRAKVLFELPRNNGRRDFMCMCTCGNQFKALGENLRKGHTSSCGCYASQRASEARMIHGESGSLANTAEFRTWVQMRGRCNNPHNPKFEDYGGRGIKVCERWGEFANFLSDMGRRPSKAHSIDREDNDGDYTPDNCKWSTSTEQANNRRNNILYTSGGRTLTLKQWSEELKVSYHKLYRRHQCGWPVEKLLHEA